MMRLEIKQLRDENNKEFDIMRGELRDGLDKVIKKIEESGSDGRQPSTSGLAATAAAHHRLIAKIISEHPLLSFNAFVFVLLLVFISGHFAELTKLFGGA
jgi:hypothetical protein